VCKNNNTTIEKHLFRRFINVEFRSVSDASIVTYVSLLAPGPGIMGPSYWLKGTVTLSTTSTKNLDKENVVKVICLHFTKLLLKAKMDPIVEEYVAAALCIYLVFC